MKLFKKSLRVFLVFLLLSLIVAFIIVRRIATRAIPDYNATIIINGLDAEIKILRDSFGVPHIFAETENDVYFATGYIMAQDRLWQMDLLRRATTGSLSEIFGKDLVETDYLLRSLRIPEKSKRVIDSLPEDQMQNLKYFSQGVNEYIKNNDGKLPLEFTVLGYKPDPWEPVHSANLIGYMAWDLASGWNEEPALFLLSKVVTEEKIKELIPLLDLQKTYVYPQYANDSLLKKLISNLQNPLEKLDDLGISGIFNASNNWAVAGIKSTTGKPILANDMHLSFSSPGIWYQIHQSVKGKVNVTGVAVPGQPYVICGHNESIAWGMTNVYVDDIDFYEETINPANSNQYKLNGTWKDLKVVNEKIKTKEGIIVEKEIKYTHRGPIVSSIKKIENAAISMRWLGNEYSNEIRSIYLLNRATNWNEFRNALKTFSTVSQNIIYADTAGNIGLYCSSSIPKRLGNPIAIQRGDTTLFDWNGFIPFDSLPNSYNPPCGYLYSANNRTTGKYYPYYIGTWYTLPYRANRIKQMLTAKEKLSIDDFKTMLADQKSLFAEEVISVIVPILKSSTSLSELDKKCITLLNNWNLILSKESSEALILEKFISTLFKNIFADELDEEQYKRCVPFFKFVLDKELKGHSTHWCDNVNTKDIIESFDAQILITFKQTINELSDNYGKAPEKWFWGKVHTLTLKHPLSKVKILDYIFNLNRGPYPIGGAYHTVSPYTFNISQPFQVVHGASHRHIFNTANWNQSLTIIPTGISGIPASSYYCNQTNQYLENKYHHDYFSRKEIESSVLSSGKLVPKISQ